MPSTEKDLFSRLPTGLFRPLASPRQRLYWRVLVRLFYVLFDEETEISEYGHARTAVTLSIATVLEQHASLWVEDPADEDIEDSVRGRANAVYKRLCQAGWLEESRHGYHDYVTMPPRVHQCLAVLIEVAEGRALVLTGKLKSLQASIREIIANPENQADTLTELAKDAKRFSRHLSKTTNSVMTSSRNSMNSCTLSRMSIRK